MSHRTRNAQRKINKYRSRIGKEGRDQGRASDVISQSERVLDDVRWLQSEEGNNWHGRLDQEKRKSSRIMIHHAQTMPKRR